MGNDQDIAGFMHEHMRSSPILQPGDNVINEIGGKIANLVNELNRFVSMRGVAGIDLPKKVGGMQGIDEMLSYINIRVKDMIFDLECTRRELTEEREAH